MSRIRGRNTKPELLVRSLLHRMGYRFRVHRRDLPGCPDITLPCHKVVVFVHGCFWHRHRGCKFAYTPKSRQDFWEAKFRENTARDQRHGISLRRLGWRTAVIWECETVDERALERMIDKLLRQLSAKPKSSSMSAK